MGFYPDYTEGKCVRNITIPTQCSVYDLSTQNTQTHIYIHTYVHTHTHTLDSYIYIYK